MLPIVINESNLLGIVLILRWGNINLFKSFKQIFLRLICEFSIGCPDDINVLFKLAEIFDSLEPGTSTTFT